MHKTQPVARQQPSRRHLCPNRRTAEPGNPGVPHGARPATNPGAPEPRRSRRLMPMDGVWYLIEVWTDPVTGVLLTYRIRRFLADFPAPVPHALRRSQPLVN